LKVDQPDFFKLLIENSKEIICLQKEDGTFLYVNPSFHEILGYLPEEIQGRSLYEWIHPDDQPGIGEEMEEALTHWKEQHKTKDNASLSIRCRVRCRNGKYKWLHAHITFIEDAAGGSTQLLTNAQDVSFYMALEEELLTLNKLSENSNALAGIGGWQLEVDSERLIWSHEVKRIHEVPPDYIPTMDEALRFFVPHARSIVESAVSRGLLGHESWDLELPIITARGNKKWVRVQGQVEVHQGKAIRIYGVLQDVTNAYRIKEQIRLNEQKFKAIFHAMFQFIGLLTPEGLLLEANESALGFAGVGVSEVLNKPFWDAYWWTDTSREQVKEYVCKAAKGEFIRDEINVMSIHQELLTLDFSIKPIFDDQGNVVLLIPEGRNITRQKQNEAHLRLMQFSIDQASLPVVWIDSGGKISYINECGARVMGMSKEEATGKKMWTYYPLATQETFNRFWERLKQEKVINLLKSMTTRDGQSIEIELTANYITYGDQEANITFFQDVTERIRSERVLVESEKRLRYALEGTGGGLWDWDVTSGEVYLSVVWKSMLGYQDTELENNYHTWYGHIHPEDKQKMLQTLQSVYDPPANTFSFTHRLRCRNGDYRHILSKGIVIQRSPQGKPERIIGINTDITGQTLTQEKLIEAQERFHHAFFNSGSGMALVAPNGGWIDVNDALCRMTGYSRSELLQMTFQDITHPEDLPEDIKNTGELLEGTAGAHIMEKRYIHKEGHTIWVNLNATLVRNKSGDPQFFVSHIQDISSLKVAQQSLERQNLRLTSSAEHLTRKNKQLAEFSQIVSHNLRAPVSNINILLQYYRNVDTEKEKEEVVELLTGSATALSETLNELTEVIKVQQDKHIKKEELRFEQVFEKVRQMHIPQIADLKAIVHHDFTRAPHIGYSRIYLESILMNLLNNALKYSEPGRPPLIDVRTYWEKGHLMLEFRDNGRGINLDKHSQNIFKLYKTFHKHPDAKGLGLYMTKNQIEAMGGKIFVESKEFEGTKFIINFNQYQAANAE
jgi:PAS domain S-box-containing protein